MPVFDGKHVVEVNVLLLFYQSIRVHETLQIYHEDVWQLLEHEFLRGSHVAAVNHVALDPRLFDVVVEAVLDRAPIKGNI